LSRRRELIHVEASSERVESGSVLSPSESAVDITEQPGGGLVLQLSGDWVMRDHLPSRDEVEQRLEVTPVPRRLSFDTSRLGQWDAALLTFLVGVESRCQERSIEIDASGLPHGVRELLRLAFAVPEKKDTGRDQGADPLLARVGKTTLAAREDLLEGNRFLGEAILSLGRFLTGRAQYRRRDLWLFIQDCGAQALGIVALITFLVGLILGYVGIQQLALFGAEIYTADLVAIAMAREMAPIMAGIIMAGRTGAAFAAQLGTMTVNEEIDALSTMGISPMDYLVLPRMLALILMMPLLCLYADLMGILGGALVGISEGGINPELYWSQTTNALNLRHVGIGVFKGAIFGILIALSGCLRGMQSGRSASAVGDAATSAVVTGIVAIILTDAVLAVVMSTLGI
jgi:phospholipid/cholesterol/gamma-HCH transport system permease protein